MTKNPAGLAAESVVPGGWNRYNRYALGEDCYVVCLCLKWSRGLGVGVEVLEDLLGVDPQ